MGTYVEKEIAFSNAWLIRMMCAVTGNDVYVVVSPGIRARTHSHTRTHAHTHIHIHTHTHTHTLVREG